MLKTALIVVALALAGVLIFAATRPDTFTVTRSASMKAPPERIQAQLSDFRGWQAWSPWEKMDPGMQRRFGGAEKGKGATYAWRGNDKVGQGSMEITESTAQKVAMDLDFVKPFEAHNTVTFTLAPKGDATDVTWSMSGPVPYFAKILHVFVDMDRMVGSQFESGLANLKAVSEK
ncbi:MAG TPA: SRPBCC family protein [Burkholderiales bacterium]|nr:SRPBCC family protein [Burkholderiales bacterium]